MAKDTSTAVDPGGPTEADLPKATSSAPSTRGEAPTTLGRFRIEESLGSGGMADVYCAYDPVLDRKVALKVLRPRARSDDEQQRRRMLREARAAAALTHANTVTIFEVGEADGAVFLAMELLQGKVLREVIARSDTPLASRLKWLLEAARALAAAHERGLVHRDVKPDNMFVCADGALKLLDFGIAKRAEDETLPDRDTLGPSSLRTAGGVRAGTPRYMAPEQRAGAPTDARTDEYAWGLVAFELLTGVHVLGGLETVAGGGAAASEASAGAAGFGRILRDRVPEVPEEVAAVIERALETQQVERFPTMEPIVRALERCLAVQSAPVMESGAQAVGVAAYTTVPDATEAPPPVRRRRWPLAALAVGIAAALTIGAVLRARRAPLPPACRVEAVRSTPLHANDEMAVMPGGAMVVAHDARDSNDGKKHGAFEHDSSGAFVRFAPLGDAEFWYVHMGGIAMGAKPALLLQFDQSSRGILLMLWRPDLEMFDGVQAMQRIFSPMSESVALGFEDATALVATTGGGEERGWAVRTRILGGLPGEVVLDDVPADSPALAMQKDRIALAYRSSAIRVVFLNRAGARVGDTLTATSVRSRPTLAFVGDTLVVFWIDATGGKTRLRESTLPAGAQAFTASRDAFDAPVADIRPVAARMGSGAWAVAWVAAPGGNQIVRVAPIGAAGELLGPTDVGTAAQVRALAAVTSGEGLDVAWADASQETFSVARVMRRAAP